MITAGGCHIITVSHHHITASPPLPPRACCGPSPHSTSCFLPSESIQTSVQKSLLLWPCNTEHSNSSCHQKLNFSTSLLQFIDVQSLKLPPRSQRKTLSKSNFQNHTGKQEPNPAELSTPVLLRRLHKHFCSPTAVPGSTRAQTAPAHRACPCRTPHPCAPTNPISRGDDGLRRGAPVTW